MAAPRSLALRATLAVAFFAAFYALALGIAGFLILLIWWDVTSARRVHGRLVLACALGAGTILWSVFPRRAKFVAPGPRLERSRHPRLFAAIDDVARETGQAAPVEVYATLDVNAAVQSVGGFLGTGSRRVLILGLPLLSGLTVAQLRAVLAHEFGHFHAGDTRLGPWIHRTGTAVVRTVANLSKTGFFLHRPFHWFGIAFFRVSHGVSRAQELSADALSAQVAGAATAASALRSFQRASFAFPLYLRDELLPALNAGFAPPFGEGFRRFLRARPVARACDEALRAALASNATDPFDTHPPIAARLAALGTQGPDDADPAAPRAETLLGDVAALEADLVASATENESTRRLPRIGWDEIVDRVLVARWDAWVAKAGDLLGGARIADLPLPSARLAELGARIADPAAPTDAREGAGAHLLFGAVARALRGAGWTLRNEPGESIVAERGGHSLALQEELAAVQTGAVSPEAWRARCEAFAIAGVVLVPAVA